jgi:hypothetical protein
MNRTAINFWLDVISFFVMVGLALTGGIAHFVLPSGTGNWRVLFGLGRRDYGQIGPNPEGIEDVNVQRLRAPGQRDRVPGVAAYVAPLTRSHHSIVGVGDGLPAQLEPDGASPDPRPFQIGLPQVEGIVAGRAVRELGVRKTAAHHVGVLALHEQLEAIEEAQAQLETRSFEKKQILRAVAVPLDVEVVLPFAT